MAKRGGQRLGVGGGGNRGATVPAEPISGVSAAIFEPSYEERAESIKELKKEIQSGYDNKFEGETYITLSFSNFKNKVAFCNRFDIPENDTIFKGEVFSGMIERIN